MAENQIDPELLEEYRGRLVDLRQIYATHLETPGGKNLPDAVMGADEMRVFNFLAYLPGQVAEVFETLYEIMQLLVKIPGQERQAMQFADFLESHSILLDPKKDQGLRKDIRSARRSAYLAYKNKLMGDPESKARRSVQISALDELILWADPGQRVDILQERDKQKSLEISKPVIALISSGLVMILALAFASTSYLFK